MQFSHTGQFPNDCTYVQSSLYTDWVKASNDRSSFTIIAINPPLSHFQDVWNAQCENNQRKKKVNKRHRVVDLKLGENYSVTDMDRVEQ